MDWTVRHVTTHPQWAEALVLFEMLADATGEGHEMLEAWRMAALEAPTRRPRAAPASAVEAVVAERVAARGPERLTNQVVRAPVLVVEDVDDRNRPLDNC